MNSLIFALLVSYPAIPNANTTPGNLCTKSDADFAEYRYAEHIPYCDRHVTTGTKRAIYEAYGIPKEDQANYTIDHLIPLSIGGSNDRKNLWTEHKAVKATRPTTEDRRAHV